MHSFQNSWIHDRGCDHYKALENRDPKNPIAKHWLEEHQGTEWEFKMTVKEVHDSPLMRQSTEGYQIANFKGDLLLNQKGEWGQNLPPKLVIEDHKEGAE